MYLAKYFAACLFLACYLSVSPSQASPVEPEPIKEENREHRLRFLVLQKSDIVVDNADDEATTVANSEQEDEDDEEDEDESAEKTTVPSSPADGVTARDENEIIEVVELKDDGAAEPVQVVVYEGPTPPIVDDASEDKFVEGFPKEPEPDAFYNETEYVHQPLDISQFPELHVNNSRVYGRATCRCGVPGRVVGGQAAQISEIPWTVGLVRAGFLGFGAGRKPFCGGTLINNLYVVTASHCVDGQFASGIRIWLNTEDLNNSTGRQVVDVASITMHPGYSRRNVDNDIALIKLASPVDFTPPTSVLAPACIPANNDNDFSTYDADVAGWGTTSSGGPQSTYLRYVTVPVITNEACNRDTMYVDKISPNMLCAGYPEGGKDACQGDSGGPLTIKNADRDTLIGVVSWGYGCAGPNAPGVYTRVGRYPQWILENTSGAEWCAE